MTNEDAKIAFYKQQFEEIHAFDTLDWRIVLILSPTFGAFFAVLGFLQAFVQELPLDRFLTLGIEGFRAFSIFVAILSFYGMWTVARNQAHLSIRVRIIEKAEEEMGVGKIWTDTVKKSPLSFITGRRVPLFVVYAFMEYTSMAVFLVDSVEKWTTWSPAAFALTIVTVIICFGIHFAFLKTSLKHG